MDGGVGDAAEEQGGHQVGRGALARERGSLGRGDRAVGEGEDVLHGAGVKGVAVMEGRLAELAEGVAESPRRRSACCLRTMSTSWARSAERVP